MSNKVWPKNSIIPTTVVEFRLCKETIPRRRLGFTSHEIFKINKLLPITEAVYPSWFVRIC